MRLDYKESPRFSKRAPSRKINQWYIIGSVIAVCAITLPILFSGSDSPDNLQTVEAISIQSNTEANQSNTSLNDDTVSSNDIVNDKSPKTETIKLALPNQKAKKINKQSIEVNTKQTTQAKPDSGTQSNKQANLVSKSESISTPVSNAIAKSKVESNTKENESTDWQEFRVKSGYNFAIISSRAGIKPSEVHSLISSGKPTQHLKKLHPGDKIKMKILPDGKIAELEYDINESKYLSVTRTGETENGFSTFVSEILDHSIENRPKHASGTIKHSLFLAAQKAGLNNALTMELANIFGWDIDFALEVRQNDSFTVIYEERYREGEKIGNGPILAAEFINRGTTYRAIRHTTPDGNTDYYTPDGKSLRKAFLRNPVEFTHISSHFNLKRKHPILHKIRAHKGVDYAAKTGTPIKAAGDGKIILRGTKGGYGNTIIVQHGQRYNTLYAHLSKFKKGLRKGSKVKQGQVIGYVGKSGLATGPHLHYEFRVNGVHKNPLKVKHPSVSPIAKQYKAEFLEATQPLLAQLDTIKRIQVAAKE